MAIMFLVGAFFTVWAEQSGNPILAKLGYKAQSGKSRKSHHKTPAPEAAAKPKAKA